MQVPINKQFALTAFVLLAAASSPASGADPTYSLTSNRRPGDTDRVQVSVEVGGHLQLADDAEAAGEKHRPLKMSVVGQMRYDERFLAGRPMRPSRLRSIRHYNVAKATIKIEDDSSQPELRMSRSVIAAETNDGVTTLTSPDGPLTRDEAELIDIQANTLLLDSLLPGKPVAIGQRWEHSEPTVIGLLGLEAVRSAKVYSVLEEVEDGIAKISLHGSLQGTAGGAPTSMGLKGRYQFDLKRSRITWLALLLKEDRLVGHVSPGLKVTARVQVHISAFDSADTAAEKILTDASLTAARAEATLTYQPPDGTFQFSYDRRWHIMTDEPNLMTMRLVEDGELIAQCKVSTPIVPTAKRPRLAEFQADVESSLADRFGQFTHASASANDRGHSIHRVIAIGQVEGLPVQWNYYHVTDEDGRQVVFAFTFEASLVKRFADVDRAILNSLQFFPPPQEVSSRRRAPRR